MHWHRSANRSTIPEGPPSLPFHPWYPYQFPLSALALPPVSFIFPIRRSFVKQVQTGTGALSKRRVRHAPNQTTCRLNNSRRATPLITAPPPSSSPSVCVTSGLRDATRPVASCPDVVPNVLGRLRAFVSRYFICFLLRLTSVPLTGGRDLKTDEGLPGGKEEDVPEVRPAGGNN